MSDIAKQWIAGIVTLIAIYLIVSERSRVAEVISALGTFHTRVIGALQGR